uniref:Uncharacterized protein n=1 Tax=Tanacetum cinerariifolium TaxID=118510 RepID=A0A6L2JBS8_TANCI|nr:hypothetical protein [Tanacetum cinerariifolium]
MFTSKWAISSLPNGIDSNPDIYPPPLEDPLLIRDALFDPIHHGGKRHRLLTLTPSGSSESTSSSSRQEEENDPVNNFTLDLIPYINQLLAIKGGESPEFKQTKGMLKCVGHFLSNLGKKKK